MRKLFLIFLLINPIVDGIAQDYHHWSEQFGARASFLGGAATAGLGDNATVFYNAAAMNYVDKPSISLSVNAYRISTVKLSNALGERYDLKEIQFSIMPSLISGIYAPKKYKKWRLGYAVIAKRNFNSKYDYLHQGFKEILSSTNGPEIFVGSYHQNHSLHEYWAGVAISFQASKHISIGLAHFGAYRNVKYSNLVEFSALPTDGSSNDVSTFSSSISFNYWNVKGVFKPSLALDYEKIRFGLVYTTPSFNVIGRAKVSRDYSIINMHELLATDLKITDRAEKIKARHQENGSLALGLSFKLGKKAWLHWTNETFFGGQYYLIFDTDQSPSTYPTALADSAVSSMFGDQNFLGFGERTVTKTNFGAGLEIDVTKKLDLYFGARTDFMFNKNPSFNYERITIDASKWDLYHFSVGFAITNENQKKYSVGLEFAFASKKNFYHVIDLNSPASSNLFLGNGGSDAKARVLSFKFMVQVDILNPKKIEIKIP